MADQTASEETVAAKAHQGAEIAGGRVSRASVTGPLLIVASVVIAALLVLETIFGLLWTLGGEFRTYISFFH